MSTDVTKQAFSSKYRYERVVLKKTYSFTVSASSTSNVTISHGLSYVPFVKMFCDFGDSKMFPLFSSPSSYNIDGNSFEVDNVYVDSQDINLSFENDSSSSVTINVHIRVYAEPQE